MTTYISGKIKGRHKLQKSIETSGRGQRSAQPDACVKTSQEDSVSTWNDSKCWSEVQPGQSSHFTELVEMILHLLGLCWWWCRTAQSKRMTDTFREHHLNVWSSLIWSHFLVVVQSRICHTTTEHTKSHGISGSCVQTAFKARCDPSWAYFADQSPCTCCGPLLEFGF